MLATRWYGRPVPTPEHVPLAQAERIAACLAELKARGTPALVNTNASSGTRVCLAAKEHGLDIAGTMFRLGGEPLTPARARVVASSGSRVVTIYGMGEIGRIGLPCAHADEIDDVHVLLDKLSVIRRLRSPRAGGPPVPVNVYTTLVSSTPKLMLNVESDDFGELQERSCGCLLDQLGLGLHLHTIRSHEKLTSEGMNFLGHDLIRLIEEVLPARFQGAPTDFQFVEDETPDGLPEVRLLVSPRVGDAERGRGGRRSHRLPQRSAGRRRRIRRALARGGNPPRRAPRALRHERIQGPGTPHHEAQGGAVRSWRCLSCRSPRPPAEHDGAVRVLMVCYEYPPLGGGIAAACSYLLAELARTDAVEVDLVTSGTQPQVERVDLAPHVRIHRLPVAKTDARFWRAREIAEWLWRALPYAGALARRQRFDIAHCWAGWPSGVDRLASSRAHALHRLAARLGRAGLQRAPAVAGLCLAPARAANLARRRLRLGAQRRTCAPLPGGPSPVWPST